MSPSTLRVPLFVSLTMGRYLAAAQPPNVPQWTLSAAVTAVGEEVEFQRIAGMARLGNGDFIVANGARFGLMRFGPSGRLISIAGRQGAGPGEFESLVWVGRRADTIAIYDPTHKRITEYNFSPAGKLGRIVRVTAAGDKGGHSVVGQLASGRWVVSTGTTPHWDMRDGQRDPTWIGTIARSGDGKVAWLGQVPGLAILVYKPSANRSTWRLGPVAFSPGPVVVAVGSTVWIGDGANSRIQAFGPEGKPRLVQLPLTARPVSPAVAEAAKAEEQAAQRGPDDGFLAARFTAPRLPKTLPVFGRAIAGPGGEVWIEEFATTKQAAARYLVIDPLGNPIARVAGPPGFRIHEVGSDYVLGIWYDDNDVEHARFHHLDRGKP
jgi:hypothetical protein